MKRDDKLFSIGEIAKALGVTRRIILHYEERGLIEPDKRDDATNNRYYTIDTFTKLRSIRSLQNLGLTLDEIRDYYNDSTDLMPLIRRMEEMRDQLNLNIEKLYERAKVSSAQVKELELPQQLIYRRTYRSNNVADKTVLLRNTALEAMRAHGTDITRRMYFIQFPIDRPAEVSCCVAVPPGSEGEYVETAAPMQAICIYHHGAYEELPAVGRQLLDYAKAHSLTPQGILRHTYLEGPPQHRKVHHSGHSANRIMVFRTAPISIPARVVSGGHRKIRLPQGPAVLNRRPLYRICAKKCGSRRPRFRFFAYPNVRSGRGRAEHFPRIYFARNWKTSPSFFCCNFYKR